jgi:hypothetical protein
MRVSSPNRMRARFFTEPCGSWQVAHEVRSCDAASGLAVRGIPQPRRRIEEVLAPLSPTRTFDAVEDRSGGPPATGTGPGGVWHSPCLLAAG